MRCLTITNSFIDNDIFSILWSIFLQILRAVEFSPKTLTSAIEFKEKTKLNLKIISNYAV